MVVVNPIHSDRDHAAALRDIERLWGAAPGTSDGDQLEVLLALVEAYEAKSFPIPPPDPIEAILFRMEQLSYGRKELQAVLGTRGRVSEVLNRKRALSLNMIRKLSQAWRIPAEILIQPTRRPKRRRSPRAG